MNYTWLVLILAFFTSNNLFSQNHYLLDDFKAYKDGSRVILNWTIKRGSTCIGVGILRSDDGFNYELIGEIKGVCGSLEAAQSYSFIDESPLNNKTNHYVLEMGFSGRTEPSLKVNYVDVSKNGYQVIPNPMNNDVGYIYYENPNSLNHSIRIFDFNGKFVDKQVSNKEYFIINPKLFDKYASNIEFFYSNIWIFEIVDDRGIIINKGKFITLNGH